MSDHQKLPPAWIVRSIERFRSLLRRVIRHTMPGNVVVYEQFQQIWVISAMHAAADLDIAGILKSGPMTSADIATRTAANEENIYRLLRALSSQGIFHELPGRKFRNTSLSLGLTDGKNSMKNMVIHHLGSQNWPLLGEITHCVRLGVPQVEKVLGKGIYDYLAGNPEASSVFNKSMHDISQLSIDPLLHAYNFSTYKNIVDVGGGKGILLSAILERYSHLTGAIFDLPDAIRDAPETLVSGKVSSRVELIPGSFFDTIPEGGDGYILKNILHNWNDEKCLQILQNIHKAALPDGRVVIIENVVNEPNKPSFAKLIDLQMMVSFPGAKERTLDEYTELLVKSGFSDVRITHTIAPFSVIDARK